MSSVHKNIYTSDFKSLDLNDLFETDPVEPLVLADPYDDDQDERTNIERFYRLI